MSMKKFWIILFPFLALVKMLDKETSFGFVPFDTAQQIGYNSFTLIIYGLAIWSIYKFIKDFKKK